MNMMSYFNICTKVDIKSAESTALSFSVVTGLSRHVTGTAVNRSLEIAWQVLMCH